VFPKIRIPLNGWFIMENPKTLLKWMLWGATIFGNILIYNTEPAGSVSSKSTWWLSHLAEPPTKM